MSSKAINRLVLLSILLLFFTIPHTLEDFATGEPAEAGVPAAVLATVISIIYGLQMLGIFWLGQGRPRGAWVHVVIGLFWPIASGFAQLPVILSGDPYRAGFISVFYVVGMLLVGPLVLLFAILALREPAKTE